MIIFHCIFAPNARHRPLLKSLMPPAARQQTTSPANQKTATSAKQRAPAVAYRRRWAELMRRVFGHQVLVCPKCQGTMKIVQFVEDPLLIDKICTHLGLPTTLPDLAPARAPPQQQISFD